MEAITIPVGRPLTFESLKALNRTASAEDLAAAFGHLPVELREQAWADLELRTALNDWNEEPA
jgi:hypothetical protein